MKISEFLTKRAWQRYVTVNELWSYAKTDFVLKPFKSKQEFLDLLSKALSKWAKEGVMPNGKVFYTELVFRKNQGAVRVRDKNCGLIKVSNPM